MLELAIIGGGPAALSAAIYAARAGREVKVFEKADFGGVLPTIPQLENYPGFYGAGSELAQRMRKQAERLGVELIYGECTKVERKETGFSLTVEDEENLAQAVLVATGSEPKKLNFELDIPVSYCALCDGAFARGKNVVVVGGANSAAQEALYLSTLAKSVTIITHSRMKADQELLNRVGATFNIKIIEQREPTKQLLERYDYCFVYIGKLPATSFLPAEILNRDGYVVTDTSSKYPHQTVMSGIFAAGDVRADSVKQVITAAGDGAMAAIEVIEWLN